MALLICGSILESSSPFRLVVCSPCLPSLCKYAATTTTDFGSSQFDRFVFTVFIQRSTNNMHGQLLKTVMR